MSPDKYMVTRDEPVNEEGDRGSYGYRELYEAASAKSTDKTVATNTQGSKAR